MDETQITISNNDGTSKDIIVNLTEQDKAKVEEYKKQINLNSTTDIIQYGVSSQNKVSQFSSEILKQVKAKDSGDAEKILLDLRSGLKSFDENINKKPLIPIFSSLKKRIARMRSEYQSVEKNINQIELKLEGHYKNLMKDVNIFDRLFVENQNYFKELSLFILAGEEKLKEMQQTTLPQMMVEAQNDNLPEKVQAYKDMQQQVIRFEKKIHDLKLTRMVVLQTAPQIRLVQNNTTSLMEKIQSSIVNTLPLWKNQMVLTLGIAHAKSALEAQKAVTDATNELLRRNSEMLKQTTVQIAKESERGIVDIETIKKANTDIITTIDEVLRIQKEGREKRQLAEQELVTAENELKNHILKSGE